MREFVVLGGGVGDEKRRKRGKEGMKGIRVPH